jgi:hypothetical protein
MNFTLRGVAAISVLSLQACSTCYTRQMVNVRPAAPPAPFELQTTQAHVTRLLIPDVLDLRLGLCEPVARQQLYLCAHFRIAPGQSGSWEQQAFQLSKAGLPSSVIKFPLQDYQLVCESRGDEPLRCILPKEIASQPDAPRSLVNSGSHKDWRFEVWAYTVQPLITFVGSPGEPDPPAWKMFSRYSTWKEYRLQLVPASEFDQIESLLQLPPFVISGKSYAVPPMSVRVAPTELCPAYV